MLMDGLLDGFLHALYILQVRLRNLNVQGLVLMNKGARALDMNALFQDTKNKLCYMSLLCHASFMNVLRMELLHLNIFLCLRHSERNKDSQGPYVPCLF